MAVRSSTLISVAFLDSAARTAISQEGIAVSIFAVSLRSAFLRTRSCPYRTTGVSRKTGYTVWVSSIVEEVSAAAGLATVRHDHDSAFRGDILSWRKDQSFDFWSYINADYTFVRGVKLKGFHVVRDPRDLIVSAYFSHLYSHPDQNWPRL